MCARARTCVCVCVQVCNAVSVCTTLQVGVNISTITAGTPRYIRYTMRHTTVICVVGLGHLLAVDTKQLLTERPKTVRQMRNYCCCHNTRTAHWETHSNSNSNSNRNDRLATCSALLNVPMITFVHKNEADLRSLCMEETSHTATQLVLLVDYVGT